MAATAATSSRQSPVLNSGIKEVFQAQNSSNLPERINRLEESAPSVEFWRGRDVAPTTDINTILRSYYSHLTVKNDKGVVRYHITASSDKGDGRLPWSQSDWTLKIHDPEMKKVIVEIKMPDDLKSRSDKWYNGFKVTQVKTMEKQDYFIVKTGQFSAYDIYCFDQEKGILTQNIRSVNNPTFMGEYLVSWRKQPNYVPVGVSFEVYNLQGEERASPKLHAGFDSLWVNEETLTIHLGNSQYPDHSTHYDIRGNLK